MVNIPVDNQVMKNGTEDYMTTGDVNDIVIPINKAIEMKLVITRSPCKAASTLVETAV